MAVAAALVCLMALAGASNAGLLRGPSQPATAVPTNQQARIAKVIPRHFSGGRRLTDHYKQQGGSGKKAELDFATEDVQRANFQAPDFVLDFPTVGASTPFGNLRVQNVNYKPALATLPHGGVAQALVTLGPCTVNQPHAHPRGTEFSWVTRGEIFFAFVEENLSAATMTGGRVLGSDVSAGNTFVVPQGLLHFEINRSCNESQWIASFPARDFGTQTALGSLFKDDVPTDVLRATTGLSNNDIALIREKVKASPNPSVDPECMKRCGFHY